MENKKFNELTFARFVIYLIIVEVSFDIVHNTRISKKYKEIILLISSLTFTFIE